MVTFLDFYKRSAVQFIIIIDYDISIVPVIRIGQYFIEEYLSKLKNFDTRHRSRDCITPSLHNTSFGSYCIGEGDQTL